MMTIIVEAVTHHIVLDHRVADQGAIRNIPTPPIRVLVLAPGPGQDQDRCLTRRHPRHLPLQDVMMDGSIAVMVTVEEKTEAEVVVETEIIREKEEEEGDPHLMGAAIRGLIITIIVTTSIIAVGIEMTEEVENVELEEEQVA